MQTQTLKQPAFSNLARLAAEVDPRIKVLATLILGGFALKAPALNLALFFAFCAAIFAALCLHKPLNRAISRSYMLFLLNWAVVMFVMGLWSGREIWDAALHAGVLVLRLAVFILLGLNLSLSTSPRSLGLAFSSLLRPFLGKKAWQAALAISLLVHFLPLTWQSIKQVQTSFAVRAPRIGWLRKMRLFVQALMRYWSQKAWKQTLGLASRGLDNPAAWDIRLAVSPGQWAMGAVVTALGVGLLIMPFASLLPGI